VHAVVVRSTFGSIIAIYACVSDHFWKFRCSKKCTPLWHEAHFEVKMYKAPHARSTWKCISKSKCTKHLMLGALLEVELLKKSTPLWPEAHLEVKISSREVAKKS